MKSMNQLKGVIKIVVSVIALLFLQLGYAQNYLVVNQGTDLVIDGTDFTMVGTATVSGLGNLETNGDSRIVIQNEGELYTSFIYNSDSIFVNSGLLDLTEFYKTENDNPYIFNADTIICREDWISQIGTHSSTMGGTAVLVHNVSALHSFVDDTTSTYNQIVFAGNNTHRIQGTILAHTLSFEGGIVDVSDNDTLIKYMGDILNPYNPVSYLEGKLYQYDQGTFRFPVGKPLLGNTPAGVMGLVNPTWVVMEAFDNAIPLQEGYKMTSLYDDNYWRVNFADAYDGSAKVVFSTSDGSITNPVIAKANSLTGNFDSYGGTAATIPVPYTAVSSNVNASSGFYLLGEECVSVTLRVTALLEGAGAGHTANSAYVYMLDTLYGNGGNGAFFTNGQAMYEGTLPSSDASNLPIDLVKVFLLEPTSPFTKVDSAFAWLMEDGSVKDFRTASEGFVSFCNPAIIDGNDYRIGFQARNHLPVISSNTVKVSTSSTGSYDFTDLTNIYGAVATKSLDGSRDYIVAGEVTGNTAINAQDFFGVMRKVYNLPVNVYEKEDLNFDMDIEGGDYNLIDYNSVRLFYSTFPD